MAQHIFRVVVRGHFADLDEEQRADLLAHVDEHSPFKSAFTTDGTFTYEPNLVAFNFRYEIRQSDEDGDPTAAAEELGMAKALATLQATGFGHKHLRVTAADMADIWQEG